jgi:outer membrane receptor protein involved in Fe transport
MFGFGKHFTTWAIICGILMILPPAFAAEQETDDLMEEISLGDLLNLEITTAGKKAEKVSEIPASVVVITREDIERYGYQDLAEILENVPGLYKIDSWEVSEMNFGVRGFLNQDAANRNIVFMVNGVRQNENFQDMSRINTIAVPVEAIDRIEVVRGPMSVIYGTGAFFGAINIITNDVSEKNNADMLSFSAGSDKTYKAAVRSVGKEADIQYALNASFYDTGGPDISYNKVGEGLREGTTGRFLENQTRHADLSCDFKGFYTRMSYDESYNARTYLFQPAADYDGENHSRFARVLLGNKKAMNNWLTLDGKIGYNHFEATFDMDWELAPNSMELQDIASEAVEAELIAFIKPHHDIDLTLGLNYLSVLKTYSYIDIPMFGLNNGYYYADDPIQTGALYAQATYKALENLSLVGGFRLEQQQAYDIVFENNRGMEHIDAEKYPYQRIQYTYDEDEIAVIPRLAAIYSVNEENIIKLLYGEAINRPSFFMNVNLVYNDLPPTLEPEKIRTMELNYTTNFIPEVVAGISLFRNELHNLVYRSHSFEGGKYSTFMTNSGKMKTNGIEFQIQAKLFDRMVMEFAAAYQDVTDENAEDIDVAFSPELLAYFRASYHTNLFGYPANFALTCNYVDEMESQWDSTPQDTSDPNSPPVGRLGDKTDDYFNVGANLRIEDIFMKGLYFNLRVSNLLDEDIYFPINANQSWATKGTMDEGRSFLVTAGWKF